MRSYRYGSCEPCFHILSVPDPGHCDHSRRRHTHCRLKRRRLTRIDLPPAEVVAAPTPAAPPPPPPPSKGPAFGLRLATGLIGVLLAVLLAGFNEHTTEMALADIKGQLHIGHDEGTWIIALFEAFNISAMAFAPWCSVTFSIRRLTIVMTGMVGMLGLVAPFMPNLGALLILRSLQCFACGCLPPMLMTVALRFTSLPIWDIAVETEGKARLRMAAYAATIADPDMKDAIARNAWEENRHKEVLSRLVVSYGIPMAKEPPYITPRDTEWAYMVTGFSECVDSFFAFGLFELAKRSGLFPVELVETFEPVMQEECRHIPSLICISSHTGILQLERSRWPSGSGCISQPLCWCHSGYRPIWNTMRHGQGS